MILGIRISKIQKIRVIRIIPFYMFCHIFRYYRKTPIPQLNEDILQFVVQDTYDALNKLVLTSYDTSDATLIATVGTNNKGIYVINALFEELLLKIRIK